jgi:peptidoglycan/LPS O-acetylase OafA/YrhL
LATITPPLPEVVPEVSARTSGERFYHPELDVLRFFAFLLVFFHHSLPHVSEFYTALSVPLPIAKLLAGLGALGAFGVDVFFVLSSYLITELLLREKENRGAVDVKAFYVRRILRIWPLYFSFIGLAVAMQWFVPGQHVGWGAGLSFLLLSGNWWLVFKGFPSSVIFPLWSVSIEEQFYLTWPAVVRRVTERGMAIAAGAMLVVAAGARWYLGAHHAWESQVWCNTFARLDPIALGIIVALLLRGEVPRIGWFARVSLAIGGIACLALAGNYWVIKGDPLALSDMMLGYPVMALGSVALLLAVLSAESPLRGGPLVFLGRVSYGLYVFHVLGLMISDYTVHDQSASFGRYMLRISVALAATIAMATVSFYGLESPFLRLKQKFTHVLSRPGG